MLKKYISKSCISLSVQLSTGGSVHLSFTPKTGGGSVFYTSNEVIQAGLESHPKYRRLFQLDTTPVRVASKVSPQEPSSSASDGLKVMSFACNDDAKDYLADKFGVSRSSMRSRSAIEEVGKEHGVSIDWTGKE